MTPSRGTVPPSLQDEATIYRLKARKYKEMARGCEKSFQEAQSQVSVYQQVNFALKEQIIMLKRQIQDMQQERTKTQPSLEPSPPVQGNQREEQQSHQRVQIRWKVAATKAVGHAKLEELAERTIDRHDLARAGGLPAEALMGLTAAHVVDRLTAPVEAKKNAQLDDLRSQVLTLEESLSSIEAEMDVLLSTSLTTPLSPRGIAGLDSPLSLAHSASLPLTPHSSVPASPIVSASLASSVDEQMSGWLTVAHDDTRLWWVLRGVDLLGYPTRRSRTAQITLKLTDYTLHVNMHTCMLTLEHSSDDDVVLQAESTEDTGEWAQALHAVGTAESDFQRIHIDATLDEGAGTVSLALASSMRVSQAMGVFCRATVGLSHARTELLEVEADAHNMRWTERVVVKLDGTHPLAITVWRWEKGVRPTLIGSVVLPHSKLPTSTCPSTREWVYLTCGDQASELLRDITMPRFANVRLNGNMYEVCLPAPHPRIKLPYGTGMCKRTNIVMEIYSTEVTYLDGLRTLTELFVEPMSMARAGDRYLDVPPLMTRVEKRTVLCHADHLLKLSERLLLQLEARVRTWKAERDGVGDIFVSIFTPEEAPFVHFCRRVSDAQSMLNRLRHEREDVNIYLNQVSQVIGGLTLESFLLTPVQRLPRYRLLLEDLLKNTARNHPDRAPLEKAVSVIRERASAVNHALAASACSQLEDDCLDELLRNTTVHTYKPKDYIIRKGEDGDAVYFIVEGVVDIILGKSGNPQLGAGEFFGEIALFLAGQKRTADVAARTYVQVYRLRKQELDRVISIYPTMRDKFVELAEERLHDQTAGNSLLSRISKRLTRPDRPHS